MVSSSYISRLERYRNILLQLDDLLPFGEPSVQILDSTADSRIAEESKSEDERANFHEDIAGCHHRSKTGRNQHRSQAQTGAQVWERGRCRERTRGRK